jgi:hypothetical protein
MEGCFRMRLIAFGCSNTYGQGLHDCYLKGGPGPHPSKYAWPAQLAKMLDCECVNMAHPGSSNKLIWHRVMNFDFAQTDIVVIHWSLLHRSSVIYKDKEHINLGLWNIIEKDIGDPWKRFITAINDDYDRLLDSCSYIDHANLYLRDKINKLANVVFNAEEFEHIPEWCSFKFDVAAGPFNKNFPMALDNAHTGPRGQKELAKAIYEALQCK